MTVHWRTIELIKLAKLSGADIAKFQIFNPVEIFTEEDNPWWEYNLANELSKDDVSKLNAECVKQGIEFMASVFDLERLQWVLDLGVKRVKIASRSINDQQLIEASVEIWKKVIISLGHWNGVFFRINNIKTLDIFTVSRNIQQNWPNQSPWR